MNKEIFKINNIPAILWGEKSAKLIIAVHGNMSNKADVPIEMLANVATNRGYQVLSFDLPEHGDRKDENTLCKVVPCVNDLTEVIKYAKSKWQNISLFANSIGAYFSLLAYKNEDLQHVWFLSPVVDMNRLISNMMMWFNVSEEKLQQEKEVPTPIGQTLYWDYYCYVKENPIEKWDVTIHILYGEKDDTCEFDTIKNFTERFNCNLKVVLGGEHYFHTEEQLEILEDWLDKAI